MATAMAVAMEAMAMEATVVDTVDIEATMARGMLRPLLMLPLMPLLMLSLGTMATVDMVLDMDMVATDSVDTTVDTEDTTARGTPRLRPVTTSVVDTTEVMDTGPGDTMVDTDTGVTTVTRGRASHAISPKFSLELSVKC